MTQHPSSGTFYRLRSLWPLKVKHGLHNSLGHQGKDNRKGFFLFIAGLIYQWPTKKSCEASDGCLLASTRPQGSIPKGQWPQRNFCLNGGHPGWYHLTGWIFNEPLVFGVMSCCRWSLPNPRIMGQRANLGPRAISLVQKSMCSFETLQLSHDLSCCPQRQVAGPSCQSGQEGPPRPQDNILTGLYFTGRPAFWINQVTASQMDPKINCFHIK